MRRAPLLHTIRSPRRFRSCALVVVCAAGLGQGWTAEPSGQVAAETRQALIAALPDVGAANALNERLMRAPPNETAVLLIELGLSGRPAARPLLVAQLRSPDALIVERALLGLSMLGVRGAEQREQVVQALAHEHPAVRIQAIACLETIDDLRVCPLIIERLGDAVPMVRRAALNALQNISGREDLGGETEAWTDWHRERQAAADERFWEADERLHHPAASVVIPAIERLALSAGDSARTVEMLEPLLYDEDPRVVFATRQALARLASDLYQWPTMQERIIALAPSGKIVRTINVAPQAARTNQWWGLLIGALTAVVWVMVVLLNIPGVRRTNKRLVRWVRGPGRFLKRGRKLSDVVVPRADASGPYRRAVPHASVLRMPWPPTGAPSIALHGAVPVEAPADEDPFTVFDRFSALPPSAPQEGGPPLTVFARSERTARILNALRAGRLHLREDAPQEVASSPDGAEAAAVTPLMPVDGVVAALPTGGSSAEPTTTLGLIGHLADFEGFSGHVALPVATATPSSLFVHTARTARVLTSLRAGRLHLQGDDTAVPSPDDQEPTAAVDGPADGTVSADELAPQALPAPDEPVSPFAPAADAATPAPPVASPGSVFASNERTTRRLRRLRAGWRERRDEDDQTATPEPATERMQERNRGWAPAGATDAGTADPDDPFALFDRFSAPSAPAKPQPASSIFSRSDRTKRKLKDLRQPPAAPAASPTAERAATALRTPPPEDPCPDAATTGADGRCVVLGETPVQAQRVEISLPAEPSTTRSGLVSERWSAMRAGRNREDEESQGF